MRWWAGGGAVVAVLVLAACGTSGGGGSAGSGPSGTPAAGPSGSPSVRPSGGPSARSSSAVPSAGATRAAPHGSASPPAAGCVAGRVEVSVAAGGPVRRQLCVRPGTVVSLVLRPRTDDRRWTGVHSSAPSLVVVSGWRVDADGTARAALRSAGTRGGGAAVTASARAPDVAGAARGAFTLDVTVVPYAREG